MSLRRPTTHLQRLGVDQEVNHFPGQPRCVSERSLWNILEHIDIEQKTYTSCMPCLTLDNPAVRLEQFGTIIVIHPLVPDTILHLRLTPTERTFRAAPESAARDAAARGVHELRNIQRGTAEFRRKEGRNGTVFTSPFGVPCYPHQGRLRLSVFWSTSMAIFTSASTWKSNMPATMKSAPWR